MSRTVLVEQFHLNIRAPAHLPASEDKALLRTLHSRAFQTHLRLVVQKALRRYASLRKATLRIER